jgi:hypothetical protein
VIQVLLIILPIVVTGAVLVGAIYFRLWQNRRRNLRPPVSERMLRPAGESLRRQLEEIDSKMDEAAVRSLGVGLFIGICFAMVSIQSGRSYPTLVQAAIILVISTPLLTYFLWRAIRLLRERSDRALGFNGERAVGEELNQLMLEGCHVFHDRLSQNPSIRSELGELGFVLQSCRTLRFQPIPGLEEFPMCLHASYGQREILTAVGWLTASRRTPFQAGVLPLKDRKLELLLVTLDKREGFHAGIAYCDYAISADRFHWQSQNAAGPETVAGKRYLESSKNGWRFQLFVRRTKGEAYHACGPVTLESAKDSKPMSIVWKLGVPMPVHLFQEFSVLRDQ